MYTHRTSHIYGPPFVCYSAASIGENVGVEQKTGEREGEGLTAILDTGKDSALSEGKKSSDLARKSAILKRGSGSTVLEGSSMLEGSSVVIEGGARGTPTTTEREGEEPTTGADLKAASREEAGGGEDSTHQRESGKEEAALGGEGAKVKPRKKKYILKGGSSALAVQLFGMDDKFEMRSVIIITIHALCSLKNIL